MPIKPFLKWPGGKFRIINRILEELPSVSRFVEPFCGSCATYLNVSAKKALICDINKDIINLYRILNKDGAAFVWDAQKLFTPRNNTKEAYLDLRDEFNNTGDPVRRASLFIYLNRHSFNGLVRYNSEGKFNVPFGDYKAPYFPFTELESFCRKTKSTKTEFLCCDFREVFERLVPGDVVYCDPPYVPLSETANFTTYTGNSFGITEQHDLASLAKEAVKKGIYVILSNHDTTVTRELYKGAKIKSFSVRRSISCKGETRGEVRELLAVY